MFDPLKLRTGVWLAIVLMAASPAWSQESRKVPVIFDCDIGTDIDDTFALALALASPEIDLRGVTTVSGDTHARAIMVCRILSAIGRTEIPVAIGTPEQPPQPLRGEQGQFVRTPPAMRAVKPIKQPAVEFIFEQLKAHPGEITLVTVGPLSNLAELLAKHPDCRPWIKRVVMMGGSVRVGYNNKAPINSEFNIRADAKAAQAVFTSGLPLTVAPLDATTMLKLDEAMLQRIFGARSMLNYQVKALWQLWNQKAAPIMFDPVAVTLCFEERFCTIEDLHLDVDDKGFTREGAGKPNARVATAIKQDEYLKWFVERFASTSGKVSAASPPKNVSTVIDPGAFPNRVHAIENFETDIEKRWWLSGKLETDNVPPGSQRACRAVLTQDFDEKQGDPSSMYSAVIFNPVPGPPMGKQPRLSFRYWLKGTDTLRVQIYSLSNGYHRCLTLTGLPQEKWISAAVDMTAARRPDGSGGPLSENERIDDIQFYCDPRADLLIDDIVLYDAAVSGDTRPFPKSLHFTGWFDTGKQGQEWPGTFAIADKQGSFWKAAQSVDDPMLGPSIRLSLRGERPLAATTELFFRQQITGAERLRVVLVNSKTKAAHPVELPELPKDRWGETTIKFPQPNSTGPKLGERIDEIHFLLPKGAGLLVDDLLLFEPG